MPYTETRGDCRENTCIYRHRKQYGWVWRNATIAITNILKDSVYNVLDIRRWTYEAGAQNWGAKLVEDQDVRMGYGATVYQQIPVF